MERSEEGEIHRSHDSCVLERGTQRQNHRSRHLQNDQVSMQQHYGLFSYQVTPQLSSMDISYIFFFPPFQTLSPSVY